MKKLPQKLALGAVLAFSLFSPLSFATSVISAASLAEYTDTGTDVSKIGAASVGVAVVTFAIRNIRRVL